MKVDTKEINTFPIIAIYLCGMTSFLSYSRSNSNGILHIIYVNYVIS